MNLEVRSGEVSCIIGPSGSGKSAFLRCLNGLERVHGGSLTVLVEQVGYELVQDRCRTWSPEQFARFRSKIGMVFPKDSYTWRRRYQVPHELRSKMRDTTALTSFRPPIVVTSRSVAGGPGIAVEVS